MLAVDNVLDLKLLGIGVSISKLEKSPVGSGVRVFLWGSFDWRSPDDVIPFRFSQFPVGLQQSFFFSHRLVFRVRGWLCYA